MRLAIRRALPIAAVCTLGLTACAPTPARQNPADQVNLAMQQRDICTRAIRAEPVYLPLLPYFSAIGTGRYDPDQLTDQHVPTAAESALLVRYFNEDDPCADGFAATAAQLVPAAEPILAQEKSDIQAVEFALINRQIAWGQAAQKQQDIRVAASAKLRALGL